MDMAAIKAYSSVIADAAEDSTPAVAVVYHETIPAEENQKKADPFNGDPMASMIQNEISDIKDASIAAAKDKEEWSTKLCDQCASLGVPYQSPINGWKYRVNDVTNSYLAY